MKVSYSMASAVTRRLFLQSAAGVFVLGAAGNMSFAQSARQQVLTGSAFDLDIGAMTANFTGRDRPAVAVNGKIPAPLLHMREGDSLT